MLEPNEVFAADAHQDGAHRFFVSPRCVDQLPEAGSDFEIDAIRIRGQHSPVRADFGSLNFPEV
jgi:hypothetical protein